MAASVTPPVGRPSGGEIPREQQMKDLQLNLRDFEEGVRRGTFQESDIQAFRGVFAGDIAKLRGSFAGNRAELRKILDLEAQFVEAMTGAKNVLASDFVGTETMSLNERARLRRPPSDDARKGTEQLNETYGTIAIKPDGHCLFRSIAVGLMKHLGGMGEQERERYWTALEAKVPQGQRDLFTEFRDMINEEIEEDSDESPFNDADRANIPVQFLRLMACEYIRSTPAAQGFIRGDVSEYLNRMTDMRRAEWGDQPEIAALSNVLGIKMQVVNLPEAGKNRPYIIQQPLDKEMVMVPTKITVIYDGTHYDLGFELDDEGKRRVQEAEQAKAARMQQEQPDQFAREQRAREVQRQAAARQQPPGPPPESSVNLSEPD